MPTIHQLTQALKIRMSADDHAPRHFHVKGPGVDVMVGLADLQVLQGEFGRRDLASALSWAGQNRELLDGDGEASMSATDIVAVGQALPRIRSVTFHSGYEVAVTWDAATRDGQTDVVDLAR